MNKIIIQKKFPFKNLKKLNKINIESITHKTKKNTTIIIFQSNYFYYRRIFN